MDPFCAEQAAFIPSLARPPQTHPHPCPADRLATDVERTTDSALHMSLSDQAPTPSQKTPSLLSLPFFRSHMGLGPSVAAPVVTATSATATSSIKALAPSPVTPSLGLWPDLPMADLGPTDLGSGLFGPDTFGFDNLYTSELSTGQPHTPSGPSSNTDPDSDEVEQLSPFSPLHDGASPIPLPTTTPMSPRIDTLDPGTHKPRDPTEPPPSCLFGSLPSLMSGQVDSAPLDASSSRALPHSNNEFPLAAPFQMRKASSLARSALHKSSLAPSGSPSSAPSMSPVPSGLSASPVPSGLSMSPPTSGASSCDGMTMAQAPDDSLGLFCPFMDNDGWTASATATAATARQGSSNDSDYQSYSHSLAGVKSGRQTGPTVSPVPFDALPRAQAPSVRSAPTSAPGGLSMAFNPSATAYSPMPNASVTTSFSPMATPAYPPAPNPFPAMYASGLPTAMEANPPPAFMPDSVSPQTLDQVSTPNRPVLAQSQYMSLMSQQLDFYGSTCSQPWHQPPSSPTLSSASALSSGSAQSPLLAPSPLGGGSRPIPTPGIAAHAHSQISDSDDLFGSSVPGITPREAAASFALTSAVANSMPVEPAMACSLPNIGTGSRRRTEIDPATGFITRPTRGRAVPTNLEDMMHLGKLGKGGRVWACKVPNCNKMFRRSEHLNRHLRSIHSEARPFKCPFDGCSKYFSRRDNLNQHKRIHTLDKTARRRRSSTSTSRSRALSPLVDQGLSMSPLN